MTRHRRNPLHPQVSTPAFKRWFGKSKIVDADGNPQRLYHMTTGNFDVFKPGGDDPRISGRAIWLTPYPENIPAAHNVMDYVRGEGLVYRPGANIMPLWARIENPLYILDADDAQYAEQFRLDSFGFPTTLSDKTIAAIKKAGYDGIVFGQWRSHEGYDLTTGRGVEVIVFDPHQLKSATGNRGTFDPDDPSIVRNPRRRNPAKKPSQTDTPAFKRWFGASKVVTAKGEPRVMYHGTHADFDVFDTTGGRRARSFGAMFTPSKAYAANYGRKEYGGKVLAVYLRIENPLDAKNKKHDREWEANRLPQEGWVQYAHRAGYDGAITMLNEYVVFDPSQVKSATDNAGTFDPNDPSIVRNPRRRGLDVRPGIPGTYRTEFTTKGGRKRAYPAQGGAAWDRTLVRVANETTVASGRVYDTVKRAERAGRATVRGKRGAVEVLRVTNPARKAKPPTLAAAGLPEVWFHGTQKAFGKLKAQGGACIWLADEAGALAYATPSYGRRSAIRLIEVTLAPDTRVVDLADASDPAVLAFIHLDASVSNMRWHGREDVTPAEMADAVARWMARRTHYDAIEARPWAKAHFRKAGADALLVRDVAGWGGHEAMPSLCLLNAKKVVSERDVAPDLSLVRAEDMPKYENPRRRKNGLLGALVVGGLGFAAGAYVEHERPFVAKAKDRLRGPTKVAREQAARLQREVFTPAPAKRVSAPAPAPAKRTATTDPAWRRERNHQGKGYSHLRTINGVDYEVWERIYSDGGKAIFLEAGDKRDRIYAPNGEEDGWVSVAAAKKAAEADAKTRKNPRRRK